MAVPLHDGGVRRRRVSARLSRHSDRVRHSGTDGGARLGPHDATRAHRHVHSDRHARRQRRRMGAVHYSVHGGVILHRHRRMGTAVFPRVRDRTNRSHCTFCILRQRVGRFCRSVRHYRGDHRPDSSRSDHGNHRGYRAHQQDRHAAAVRAAAGAHRTLAYASGSGGGIEVLPPPGLLQDRRRRCHCRARPGVLLAQFGRNVSADLCELPSSDYEPQDERVIDRCWGDAGRRDGRVRDRSSCSGVRYRAGQRASPNLCHRPHNLRADEHGLAVRRAVLRSVVFCRVPIGCGGV